MSTKQHPGPHDCYAKLADDEPYFVLRAKDPIAPALVELWATLREGQYGHYPKLTEARVCAAEMRQWRASHFARDKPTVAEPVSEQEFERALAEIRAEDAAGGELSPDEVPY